MREAIAGLERLRGQEHFEMLQPLLRLGQLLGEAGRPQEAATEIYRARRLAHALLGSESWVAQQSTIRTLTPMRKIMISNMIGTLVLALLAAGAFAIAWSMVKDELTFLADSRIVNGEVIDHVFERGSDSGPMESRSGGGHHPIVRYRDEAGREHRVRGRVGAGNRQTLTRGIESGSNYHPVGSTLNVAYRRDDPEDARVLGFGQQYLFPLIISVIGMMLLMFAVLVFREGIAKV